MLMNNYLQRILSFAFTHGIGITLCRDFSPFTPSGANPERKQIVINMRWHRPQQLPYITAHEIAHILNEDSGLLYFSGTAKTAIEGQANRGAIDILIPIYFQDIEKEFADMYAFMNEFEIPGFMEDYVSQSIQDFYS